MAETNPTSTEKRLLAPLLSVASSPHVRTRETIPRIMWTVNATLAPVAIWAVYVFGWRALIQITVGVGGTYTIEFAQEAFVVEGIEVSPAFDAVGFLNYQTSATPLPQLKMQGFVEWNNGPHNLRLTARYWDEYEDQRAGIFPPATVYPQGQTIDSWTVFDLSYRVFLPWDVTAVGTITNLTDEDPPCARLDLNYDPFTHNGLGRTIKFSLTKKF